MRYQINILFDPQSLEAIYNLGLGVTVVQNSDSTPTIPNPVAWQMFQPFESNTVAWDDDYAVYATDTPLIAGAGIVPMAMTPGRTGWRYSFANGEFTTADGGNNPQGYEIVNAQDSPLRFGTTKAALVNGAEYVTATSIFAVAPGQSRNVTPQASISVFLSTYLNRGMVLRMVPINALLLQLSPGSPLAQIQYDPSTNGFILDPSASAVPRAADRSIGQQQMTAMPPIVELP